MLVYTIPCECGHKIEATSSQAGAEITCECGKVHKIPLLSEMRRLVGQAAYDGGTIGKIKHMIAEGELPWGDTCAISYRPTSESCNVYVQYEFAYTKRSRQELHWLGTLTRIFLPFGALLPKKSYREEEQSFGFDKEICIPLRVCKEQQYRLGRIRSQRKLRSLLRTVPIYAKLLDEYPKAKIFV